MSRFTGMTELHWYGLAGQIKLYINTVLSFGSRSAPKIFSAIADALEWVLTKYGVTFILHYLDDCLTIGKPESKECKQNLETIQKVCRGAFKTRENRGPNNIPGILWNIN